MKSALLKIKYIVGYLLFMDLDWNIILTLLFGSGIIGSIIITWYQFRLQRRSEINRNIEMVYLDQGIDAINSDISRYGLTCTTTIGYILRNLELHRSNIKEFIDSVSKNKLVRDSCGI